MAVREKAIGLQSSRREDVADHLVEAANDVEVLGWLPFHGEQAHPSPTPAADADRVRIAVEALERGIKRCETYEQIRIGGRSETAKKAGTLRNTMSDMNEALAALKSEGK